MPAGDKLDYPYVLMPVFPLNFRYLQDNPSEYKRMWKIAKPIVVERPHGNSITVLGAGWPEAGGHLGECGGCNTYYYAMCTRCARQRGYFW